MTTPSIPGFTEQRVSVDGGVTLEAAVGGSGAPVVLPHGFPQTHLMWRHVAADHTVVCPDPRGYGASDKPAETGPDFYSKRAMARDVVRLAAALGHDRFTLAGQDRGALVAFRAAMGHSDAVARALFLDVLPILDMWDALRGVNGAVGFHLYLMAQAPGLPEEMIQGAADTFFSYFLDSQFVSRSAQRWAVVAQNAQHAVLVEPQSGLGRFAEVRAPEPGLVGSEQHEAVFVPVSEHGASVGGGEGVPSERLSSVQHGTPRGVGCGAMARRVCACGPYRPAVHVTQFGTAVITDHEPASPRT
ncbi:alpha/beta hydrolase [Streptomyces sp. 372A]